MSENKRQEPTVFPERQFEGISPELLVQQPMLEVAKGQSQLSRGSLDSLGQIAWDQGAEGRREAPPRQQDHPAP